jgi:hypothetical protein
MEGLKANRLRGYNTLIGSVSAPELVLLVSLYTVHDAGGI